MPEPYEYWDPNEWEQHVYGLLQDRHGAVSVMKVPARHKGDSGIDYYCLCDHVVYQCFAVQEPCTVADRADKQKSKITKDLKKFSSNGAVLGAMLRGILISRWVLLVPLHDSVEVNCHLATKSEEVRRLGLPYVAKDFEVLVHDLDAFDERSRQARALQRRSISLPLQPPTEQEIEKWTEECNPLVSAVERKLRKRCGGHESVDLGGSVREVVGWFLERENSLADLRSTSPQLHEALIGVIARHDARLSLYGPPAIGAAHDILRHEVEALSSEFKETMPNLTPNSVDQMTRGTVADWLLRCPLDFPPYDHAS
jgi:hypothetical protein